MAQFKKNAMNQVLFLMVDPTDFATIKSALTNAPTGRFFGVNHGGSAAATSGALSKVVSHVHSGLYRATIKATECNYDYLALRFVQPSCADQILVKEPVTNNDSNIKSQLLVIQSMASDAASAAQQGNSRTLVVQSQASDVYSLVLVMSDILSNVNSMLIAGTFTLGVSNLSDIGSRVWADAIGARVDSRVLINKSAISDVYSMLSDMQSDFQSRVPKRVATDSQLSDLASDLKSFLTVMSGVQSDVYSLLSDFQSDFQSRVPKRVATDSQLSDVSSDLRSLVGAVVATATAVSIGNSRILVVQSQASDVWSMLSDMQSDFQSRVPKRVATDSQLSDMASDLKSAIAGIVVTITPSDISDIGSQVWANAVGAAVSSRILLAKSSLSDIYSLLVAGVPADASTMSDIRSAITAGPATAISTSDISDIASAVRAMLVSDLSDILSAATQINSRVLINKSAISDVYSMLSDMQSDFQSRVPKRVATDSQLSDMASDLKSAIAGITVTISASDISDIGSQVWANVAGAAVASRVLLAKSSLSDIYSLLSDFQSDFQSRVPKRVATDSQLSDMASDLKSVLLVVQSMASDAASAAQQGNSRLLVNQSVMSDVYSLLSDVQSDMQSRFNIAQLDLDDIQTRLPSTLVLKKNTALSNFEFFLKDGTDHVSAKTGATVTARRSIDGGATATCTNGVVEVGIGIYKINLSAADLNGDVITFEFTASGADPVAFTVLTES